MVPNSAGVLSSWRLIEIDFGDQEIDERPHPGRQPAAMAHIDDVELLDIARIIGLQHRNKSSRVDVRSNVEQGQSRDALAGQSEAARNLAITRSDIAPSRQRHVGPVNDERPLVDMARKVEGDAIVDVQIVGRLRHIPTGQIGGGGDHGHSALSELAGYQL